MAKCPYCYRKLEDEERYCYFCDQDVGKEKDKDERPDIDKPEYDIYEKIKEYVKRLIKAKKLVRETGWLYYIDKQGDISRSRMKRYHETGKAKREKVLKLGIVRKPGLLYYLDKDLNVQTSPMKRGKK